MTRERLKGRRRTIYHDAARVISVVWLAKARACGSSFPKMQIIPRLGRLAVSRRNKLRRMSGRRRDDIQIRGAENDKNIHMTRTLHISRVIGWYSDIGELSFAFILHRAKGHFARENRKTPVSIIQISVITSRIAEWLDRQSVRLLQPGNLQMESVRWRLFQKSQSVRWIDSFSLFVTLFVEFYLKLLLY